MKKSGVLSCLVFLGAIFLTPSCKKEARNIASAPVGDSSHFSITNASPSIANLYFYLNNRLVTLPDSPFSYGKTVFATYIRNATSYFPDTVKLPYININPGYNEMSFASSGNGNFISALNMKFEPDSNYSLFLMDTIVHGKVASVLLNDHLIKTDSTKSQIRFLNLAPDAPPLDIWAFPNGSYTGYKLFSDCGYLPNDFNSFVKDQFFTLIGKGPYYFVAAIAGTNNLVLDGQMYIPAGNVITLYVKGYMAGTGVQKLDIGVIQYRP